jgi:hypothetical protein
LTIFGLRISFQIYRDIDKLSRTFLFAFAGTLPGNMHGVSTNVALPEIVVGRASHTALRHANNGVN